MHRCLIMAIKWRKKRSSGSIVWMKMKQNNTQRSIHNSNVTDNLHYLHCVHLWMRHIALCNKMWCISRSQPASIGDWDGIFGNQKGDIKYKTSKLGWDNTWEVSIIKRTRILIICTTIEILDTWSNES